MMDHCTEDPCIRVKIGRDLYRTEIEADGHLFLSDEPEKLGGKNLGPNPVSIFLSSLGACTAITLRMYADRKKWDIEQITIELSADTVKSEQQQTTYIKRHISFKGTLDDKQKQRLLEIADHCPLHRMMTNPVVISTNLK